MNYNITSDSYSIVERLDSDFYSFKIVDDCPFKDVVYTYGKVSIVESKQEDKATLKFTFKVEEKPTSCEVDLDEDIDFKYYIGAVLNHYMYTNLDNFAIGNNEKSGTADSK